MTHCNCRCDFNPRSDFESIKSSIERTTMFEKKEKLTKDVKLAFNRYMDNFDNQEAGMLAFELLRSTLDQDSNYIWKIEKVANPHSIVLWGKPISRSTAVYLIVQDKINSCVHGGDEDHLFEVLMSGDDPVDRWSDEDIVEYLDTLVKENFTKEQLSRFGY